MVEDVSNESVDRVRGLWFTVAVVLILYKGYFFLFAIFGFLLASIFGVGPYEIFDTVTGQILDKRSAFVYGIEIVLPLVYAISLFLLSLAVKFEKKQSLKDYLGFDKPSKKDFIFWSKVMGFYGALTLLYYYLQERPFHEAEIYQYDFSISIVLLVISVAFIEPLYSLAIYIVFILKGVSYKPENSKNVIFIVSSVYTYACFNKGVYIVSLLPSFVLSVLLCSAYMRTKSFILVFYMKVIASIFYLVALRVYMNSINSSSVSVFD